MYTLTTTYQAFIISMQNNYINCTNLFTCVVETFNAQFINFHFRRIINAHVENKFKVLYMSTQKIRKTHILTFTRDNKWIATNEP